MMFNFRASNEKDAHYLIDIDLKCFDYAWSPATWREVAKTCYGSVATWNDTPVGMVIFGRTPYGDIEVLRLAVKEQYRNKGVGSRLLYNCARYGQEINATRLFMVVPESRLGGPDDFSMWLSKRGFRAQVPLLKNQFTFYGEPEDAVVFSFRIPQVNE